MDKETWDRIEAKCREGEEYMKAMNLPMTPLLARHLIRYGPPEDWRSKVKKISIIKQNESGKEG